MDFFIFLIRCNFVLPGNIEPSKDDGAGSSGHAEIIQEVEMEDKFPTYMIPKSLSWIFSLLEWAAKEWPKLAEKPGILEGRPIIEKLREKVVIVDGKPKIEKMQNEKEVALDLAVNFRGYQVDKVDERNKAREEEKMKRINDGKYNSDEWKEEENVWKKKLTMAKYPNSKELNFWSILEKVLNEVVNTESEISKGLQAERQETEERIRGTLQYPAGGAGSPAAAEEDKTARRLRHKNEFQFAFMVDCIYTAHMDAWGHINFGDLQTKLQNSVTKHPLHGILMANKCGDKEVIDTFSKTLMDEINEFNLPNARWSIEHFFYHNVLQKFLDAMERELAKKELEEKQREWQAKTEGKPAPPAPPPPVTKPTSSLYLPEKLPKLHTFACLIKTLFAIIESIVDIIEKDVKSNESINWLKIEVQQLSINAIDGLADTRKIIYYAIQNGTHYADAVKKLSPDHGIKEKMHKITEDQSFFTFLLGKTHMYTKLSDKIYYVHIPTHLAINTYGFNEEHELPSIPAHRNENDLTHLKEYWKTLLEKITGKIVKEYRDSFKNSGKSVPELDEQLLHQLKLNVVCVGVQAGLADAHKYTNFLEFYNHFHYLLSQGLSGGTDRQNALQILAEMEKDVQVQGKTPVPVAANAAEEREKALREIPEEILKKVLPQGIKQIYKKICGPRKVEVPAQGG